MSFEIIHESLLESDAKYIGHQCNCLSSYSAGLASSMFDKFPYENVYQQRVKPYYTLGEIIIRGNGKNQRFIINMFGQYYPGRSKDPRLFLKDGPKERKEAFQDCLQQISAINDLNSIAFPWMIGCGLAGGDWDVYLSMIESFSKSIDAKVLICKLQDS